jgi:hypothetical protein
MRGNTISLFLSMFRSSWARYGRRSKIWGKNKMRKKSKSYCRVQKLSFSYIKVLHVLCVQSRVAIESALMPNVTRLIAWCSKSDNGIN